MNALPQPGEYAPFYQTYVALVPEADVLHVLEDQAAALAQLASSFSPGRERFRYAPGKWSVREVFGHINDAERVFGFRAFCFGRGDRNPLPAFDENDYVKMSGADDRRLSELVAEFDRLRQANLTLLATFDAEAWRRVGTASGRPVSVRALAYIMAGHVRHHIEILSSRYAGAPGS
jgi:hypothetical protein